LARTRYDDGGLSGGNLERPALQLLLADIRTGRIDIVVVYKVDRLTRSLADFARLVELFDAEGGTRRGTRGIRRWLRLIHTQSGAPARIEEGRFARDSLLEESGFEPSVPPYGDRP
jgi:hypothetical protein